MTNSNTTPPGIATSPGGYCAACGAALAAGARFCHRCGTPAGQGAPQITPTVTHASSTAATVLPWGVAFVALLVLVAAFAGKNFGKAKGGEVDGSSNAIANPSIDGQGAVAGGGGGGGAAPPLNASGAPDISSMSANERAIRLYNRVMTYAENNKMDSARFFGANMAIPAHQMIDHPSNDERFHLGRLGEVVGDPKLAMAEADTILQTEPTSLLGLLLGARAARMSNDKATAAKFDKKFLSVLPSELAKNVVDYQVHKNEIDRATEDARGSK